MNSLGLTVIEGNPETRDWAFHLARASQISVRLRVDRFYTRYHLPFVLIFHLYFLKWTYWSHGQVNKIVGNAHQQWDPLRVMATGHMPYTFDY